jgi:hypothetical protein
MEMTEAMSQSAWVGKRVFVTGNTGFKGAWMSLLLSHYAKPV